MTNHWSGTFLKIILGVLGHFRFCFSPTRMLGFVLVSIITSVLAIPDGYILHVNPSCGATTSDVTTISVISDMDTEAVARCKDTPISKNVDFTEISNVLRRVTVKTEGTSLDCIFYKKDDAKVYTLEIEVSYGQPGAYVHMQSETYLITCTYDKKGLNVAESASRLVTDPYIAAKEISSNLGADSNGTFALQMVDVLGRPITGNVPIGRMVRLKGLLSGGTGNEPGVRAVSCLSQAGGSSFAILRGGCGDGIVFKKLDGFVTSGRDVLSPYFPAFRLDGQDHIIFSCNFTVCTTNCDGSSCAHGSRRKRDVADALIDASSGDSIESATGRLNIHSPQCRTINQHIDFERGLVRAEKPSEKHDVPQYFFVGSIFLGVFAVITIVSTIICFAKWENKHREVQIRQAWPIRLSAASDP